MIDRRQFLKGIGAGLVSTLLLPYIKLPSSIPRTYPEAILADNPVAYWPLGEISDIKVYNYALTAEQIMGHYIRS